jgi:hypothetical protein
VGVTRGEGRERANGWRGTWGYGVLQNAVPQKANDLNLTLGGLDLNNLGKYCKLVVVVDLIIRFHISLFSLLEGHGKGR